MRTPLRVICLSDSAADVKRMVRELHKLEWPIQPERVETADALRERLQEAGWDLILADWSVPQCTALTALGVLKELRLDIPFIVVSGSIGEENAAAAMRAGADDFVLKDRLSRLPVVIERALREHQEHAAQRRTEAALRESEARFARLADSGIVGILISDIFGNTYDANDAYLHIVGYSRQALSTGAIRWNELTAPEYRFTDELALEELRRFGTAQPWEKELIRKDGSRVRVLLGVAMLEHPKCIVFIADLTAQKRAEEARAVLALEAQREQAGRRRAEEALRQSEEQLRQAQKMEAIGRLAGGVAHDFNNLLSVILGYADLVLLRLDPAEALHAHMIELRSAAQRAATLTHQLLAFSRKQVLQPRILDINHIVGNMERMLRRLIGEDVHLMFERDPNLGYVRADPGQFEQVLLNLVVNARDAMPTGGSVVIRTTNRVLDTAVAGEGTRILPGPYVVLSVKDTGCGIDETVRSRLFEPFFTTKDAGRGTGLGLSTVYGIVRQSGGHIRIESTLGKGSTFEVFLPCASEQQHKPEMALECLSGPSSAETVLLVEDEDAVRRLTAMMLRSRGYKVLEAANGSEALHTSEQYRGPIQLLLADVVMPGMSGRELAERLTLLRPSLRTLYMSGYNDESVIRHGLRQEWVHFLQKPFTIDALLMHVRQALNDTDAVE